MATLAAALARRHGVDSRRAVLAGWLHDWLKPWPTARLLRLLSRYHERLDAPTRRLPVIWHGPAAAAWARHALGLTDRGVLDAVRWHTTGRPGMTALDRILFIADFAAAGRDFPEARVARRLAGRDLGLATRYCLASKLAWLRSRGARPHPAAFAAWHHESVGPVRA